VVCLLLLLLLAWVLFKVLLHHAHERGAPMRTALDVGCGVGGATFALAMGAEAAAAASAAAALDRRDDVMDSFNNNHGSSNNNNNNVNISNIGGAGDAKSWLAGYGRVSGVELSDGFVAACEAMKTNGQVPYSLKVNAHATEIPPPHHHHHQKINLHTQNFILFLSSFVKQPKI
jgi:hypothetical protein